MTTDLLASTRSKINRAKKHFDDLGTEISAYHGRNPYRIVTDQDSEPPKEHYRFEFTEAIPCDWASVIGDVVHNLRAALDTLATALAVLNGTTSPSVLRKTYFPIGASKEIFDGKLPNDLRGASPEARSLVERMKPYKGGTEAFWQIHQLDILDKHTSLIPVGTSHSQIIWKVSLQGIIEALGISDPATFPELPPVAFTPANRHFPLKNGDIIFTYDPGTDTEGKHKGEFKFTLDISFGEGQIIDGQPVVPSLKQFIDFVAGTVDIFDRNIFGGPAQPA